MTSKQSEATCSPSTGVEARRIDELLGALARGSGRVHMIGIAGSSMSGLALLLRDRGYAVSGSDLAEREILTTLRAHGIDVMAGNRADHVDGAALVVYTHALRDDDVELLEARRRRIPAISRSELLGLLCRTYGRSVAVCGTHGKTTVTSLLAQILVEAGVDPTVHIGGVLPALGGSVRSGRGDVFLTEACEFRRSFLDLDPTDIVLLNIDRDHLDCYQDLDDIEAAFGSFLSGLPSGGWALGWGEDRRVARRLLALACPTATFGATPGCDYCMRDAREDGLGRLSFDFCHGREPLGRVRMAVPGLFNARNAVAALAQAHHMGVDPDVACAVAARFTGARRRFERTGALRGAELYHDYGHNPVEIKESLSIARKRCAGRLWAVVQPHTYSRVKTLFADYLTCTRDADVTLVTDICGAREDDPGDVNSAMLVEGMRRCGVDAMLAPGFQDAAEALRRGVRAGDLVITLGCGDINLLNGLLASDE